MSLLITEILKEIDLDATLLKSKYKRNDPESPLAVTFECAFRTERKFKLPPGAPPFKESGEPIGTTPSNFFHEIRKFGIYMDPKVPHIKKEKVFIQSLEAIHPAEAKILIAIKDQTLTQLYPNITRTALVGAGYLPPMTPEEALAEGNEPVKRGRGRPRKTPPSE